MRNILLFSVVAAALGASANSPYINKVYEYCPAPGQFVNELPEYEVGDDYNAMLAKAGLQLAGDKMPGMVTLGAWGGYVVFGFDHPIINKPGEYDFKIYGNAMISDRDNRGGSSEPGIVMVSADINANGLPDDPWYELAGSEYAKPSTFKNYEITYTAPSAGHVATPDPDEKAVIDTSYIPWSSNDPAKPAGYVAKNSSHTQSYWPEWIDKSEPLKFTGTKLADNYEDISGDGSYFVLKFYDWGYADNLPNAEDKGFNIEWAVDSDGMPVKLDAIDFIRVHTAVNQTCGRLGESSAEVSGAEDLHPDCSGIGQISTDHLLLLTANTSDYICVRTDSGLPYTLYSASGNILSKGSLHPGDNRIPTACLPSGFYLLHTPSATLRFMK